MPRAATCVAAHQLSVVVLLVCGWAGVEGQIRAIQVAAQSWNGAALEPQLEWQRIPIHHAHVVVVATASKSCLELGVHMLLAAPVAISATWLALATTLTNVAAIAIRVAPHLGPEPKASKPSIGRKVV
eukprot:CAMPEP_0181420402 /NCGR_PEP_ID=MMETSP1110-20121109/12567_1 /TAXON_ID=174948 /ORGANISM="Symbiodinium sp., Strain CCMP421" /LENGTH=127 /DNA_ID=CAMNT_0023543441 /DNA_START=151 /DNA_END=534 /DNA_ORIENTATION=-